MAVKGSAAGHLSFEDWQKWGHNALLFLAPALLVLLASVVDVIPSDWKYGAVVLYGLNLGMDLLRKWLVDNKK